MLPNVLSSDGYTYLKEQSARINTPTDSPLTSNPLQMILDFKYITKWNNRRQHVHRLRSSTHGFRARTGRHLQHDELGHAVDPSKRIEG